MHSRACFHTDTSARDLACAVADDVLAFTMRSDRDKDRKVYLSSPLTVYVFIDCVMRFRV